MATKYSEIGLPRIAPQSFFTLKFELDTADIRSVRPSPPKPRVMVVIHRDDVCLGQKESTSLQREEVQMFKLEMVAHIGAVNESTLPPSNRVKLIVSLAHRESDGI